jgi:hypothetical protein
LAGEVQAVSMLCLPHPYVKAIVHEICKKQKRKNFLHWLNLIHNKCISTGSIASENKVMEALGKFMKVCNKKRIEMKRKSF